MVLARKPCTWRLGVRKRVDVMRHPRTLPAYAIRDLQRDLSELEL
jgi:hypothetical protein